MIIRSRYSRPVVASDSSIAATASSCDFTSAASLLVTNSSSRGPDAVTDAGLVAVGLRGVEVAVSDGDRVAHRLRSVAIVDDPGPEAELGNLQAVREGVGLVEDHGVSLGVGACRAPPRQPGPRVVEQVRRAGVLPAPSRSALRSVLHSSCAASELPDPAESASTSSSRSRPDGDRWHQCSANETRSSCRPERTIEYSRSARSPTPSSISRHSDRARGGQGQSRSRSK
jgi:hypothetical protein